MASYLIGFIVLLLFVVVFMYNSLVRMRNRKDEAWSDIDVQLKRRYDLVPNLVNTVKGYAQHEKDTFAQVTEMRTRALQANGVEAKGQAENMLTDALKSVFAVAEQYPDLQASANFVELQKELSDTENKIQSARRFYNAAVQDFNTAVQVFPKNILARLFRFGSAEFFTVDESEQEAVSKPTEVSF